MAQIMTEVFTGNYGDYGYSIIGKVLNNMYLHRVKAPIVGAIVILLAFSANAQTTVYNNFGPEHEGWDYNYQMGWTVAGINVPQQYGVEQAMQFYSTEDGFLCDIWAGFFYVPSSAMPDTVTIMLCENPSGLPPDSNYIMESWVITEFEDWSQWSPPIHLQGNGTSELIRGGSYWLWAAAKDETWTGWCLNVNPALTCPHTIRREGEDWLSISDETASAFRVDVELENEVTEQGKGLVQGFELLGNYPNPFNASTVIRFNLAEPGHVNLTVFDLLGRKISVLLDRNLEINTHQVIFNADNLPAGTYFYRLTVDGQKSTVKSERQTAVGKMLLVK